jgi:hypothetical protein
MTRGVLLFAFNNAKFNYYDMAVATAKRVNRFLNLPCTVVTDQESLPETTEYLFHHVKIVKADKSNVRAKEVWVNKGRYQAYELSPYDETLLLDTDYMINSDQLLKTFDISDFCCHDTTSFLMQPTMEQEFLSPYSCQTLWATVIQFKKSTKAQQVFECLEMVQNNFEHYAHIHNFIGAVFRNDYALTLALRIVNGHTDDKKDIIPWNLVHIGKGTTAVRNSDTEYTVVHDHWNRGKIRKEYITLKDTDFHCINKETFMELI